VVLRCAPGRWCEARRGLPDQGDDALKKPLSPSIRIDLTLPDGTSIRKLAGFAAETFSASTETCDVRIGDNAFVGDLHTYTIRAQVEEIGVDVTLTGQVPAWRPETGYWLFGEEAEHFFAWLPSVPQGRVEATYRVDGTSRTVAGVGYHDHNWGNAPMLDLMHHWYWARGAAGPYSVIASFITAEKRYGYDSLPVFMLARDGGADRGRRRQGHVRGAGPVHRHGDRQAGGQRDPLHVHRW
jgi:hypothetical protein